MTTFPQVLSRLLAHDPGRPLVTFYDDATGERTELSVTTYANWVAKVASLLVEELEVEQRQRAAGRPARPLARPRSCWALPGPAGSRWSGRASADAVVTGPDGLDRWAGRGDTGPGGGQRAAAARRCGSPSPAGRRPRSRRRGVVAARRLRRVAGARRTTTAAVAGRHPRGAVESGRRRESHHRRRPPPLGDEPGFPFRSRFLHRAAGSQRLHGPGRPHVRGATRADRGRRARHGTLRPRSARQVVASESLAEIQRRRGTRWSCPAGRRSGRCSAAARAGRGGRSGAGR